MTSPFPEEAPLPSGHPTTVGPMTVEERSRLFTELVRAGVIVEYAFYKLNDHRRQRPCREVIYCGRMYEREPGPPSQKLMEWLAVPLQWWEWHQKGPRFIGNKVPWRKNHLASHSAS